MFSKRLVSQGHQESGLWGKALKFEWQTCTEACNDWLFVLGFNTTLTANVISCQSVTHTRFLAFSNQYLHNFSFQSHRLLFSHASAEVRGENTPEKKVASTGDRTQNHQVMISTRSPLSHPSRARLVINEWI